MALISEPVKLRRDFPKWSDKGAPENRREEGIPYTPFPFSSLEGGFRIFRAEEAGASIALITSFLSRRG